MERARRRRRRRRQRRLQQRKEEAGAVAKSGSGGRGYQELHEFEGGIDSGDDDDDDDDNDDDLEDDSDSAIGNVENESQKYDVESPDSLDLSSFLVPPSAAARVVLVIGLANPEVMRDEIYLQVMRQMHGNPSARSVIHSWQLLSMLCTTLPPSATFGE